MESSGSDLPASAGSALTAKTLQFRLSTIFVLTLVAGVLAAFLSPRGNERMLAGLVTTAASLVAGVAVGCIRPPLLDRVFWGVVVAAMMQAVCATVVLFDRIGIYAWPLAAGLAAVAAVGRSSRYPRMLVSGTISAAIIALYMVLVGATSAAVIANMICAAIGGALLVILIDAVGWLEQQRRIPQPAIGLVLVLAAIGFAIVAPKVIPGW